MSSDPVPSLLDKPVANFARHGKMLGELALLVAVYYLAARAGLLLAFAQSNATPVWPPSGIAFAAIVLFGYRLWPGILVGAFAANVAVFEANHVAAGWAAGSVSLVIACGNTLEALAGAYFFRRFCGTAQAFDKLQNTYKFAVIGLLVCAISAGAGTSALIVDGIAPASALWTVLSTWWLGDLSGVVIVAPVILAWRYGGRLSSTPARIAEALVGCLMLILMTGLIFGRRYAPDGEYRWLAYLFIPCIGWAAYRYGLRGASLVSLLAAVGAVWGSTRGLGPFPSGTLNDALVAIETFVTLCSLIGLILCADRREGQKQAGVAQSARRFAGHWSTLFICVGLSVFVWNLVASDTERRAHEQFEVVASSVEKRIRDRMASYEQVLRSTQALFRATSSVERDEWHDFISAIAIERDYPGLLGVGYSMEVAASEKRGFEQRAATEGLAGYRVWPDGKREQYSPILYIEPLTASNQRVLGYDMFSNPARRAAMEQARDTGQPRLSAMLILQQDAEGGRKAGFIMCAPVYRNDLPATTVAERRTALKGYVYSAFRASDLMHGILGSDGAEVEVEIFDGNVTTEAARMYSSQRKSLQEQQTYPNPYSHVHSISVEDHDWTLRITSLTQFEQSIDRQKPQIVLIAGIVISLLFFGFVRALTARREYATALADDMTAALRASEKKFESLVDAASEFAIIATSPDGIIRVFSAGAERMLGYCASQMVGVRTPLVIHKEEEIVVRATELASGTNMPVSGFEAIIGHALHGHADSRHWTYVRSDGSTLPVNLVVTAIAGVDGSITGYLGVANDVTLALQMQDSLLHAKEQAEAASRAKSEFVANMSHEIRTPLNAVLGVAHLLNDMGLSPDQKKYLDMIRESGQSLMIILNDILNFSKIEAGGMELDLGEFELDRVLNALAPVMAMNAGEKDLELVIGVEPDVPRRLVGDALRLQQILINVTSNAIKFTPEGEVSMNVECSGRTGNQVLLRFRICDTGIGMSDAQQARIFAAFTQADSSMTRRFGGTGLGLAISRGLIELMGGTITVNSAIGRGSEFCINLPITVGADADVDSAGQAERQALRLLVIDDNASSRACLCKTIRSLGWSAHSIDSGLRAVEHLRDQQAIGIHYDAALVDWNMPDMDGIATMRAIRDLLPESSGRIVIMVSAFGREKLLHSNIPMVDAMLLKPVTGSSVFDVLHEALALRPHPEDSKSNVQGAASKRVNVAGVRLLLVEDHPLNQLVARGMLEHAGATVHTVDDGRQAVELLRDSADRFDLILMDVQMPVMDGLTATDLIRRELGLTIPVLAMSAGVTFSEREQCLAAGMNDFVAKPINVEDLINFIARFLPQPARATPTGHVADGPSTYPIDGVFDPGQFLKVSEPDSSQRRMFLDLIDRMTERSAEDMQQARSAWSRGNAEEAGRLLHTMRGAIGSIGAKRFTKAALALESALRTDQGELVDALFDSAELELEATCGAARRWLAQQSEFQPTIAGRAEHSIVDRVMLDRLRVQLADSNVAACVTYLILRGDLARHATSHDMAALDRAMDQLDFNRMLGLLDMLS